MIKVSVILPVYGVSEYIEKCTESLLNQSIKEVEYIFVDDHGPDNSIELAKNKIKGWFKKAQKAENIEKGKELIKDLAKTKAEISEIIANCESKKTK